MKFSAALAMGIAPIVLAKSVHNVYPVRRDGHLKGEVVQVHKNKQVVGQPGGVVAQPGQVLGAAPGTPIIVNGGSVTIVWQNPGAGAPTQTINPQQPPPVQSGQPAGAVQTHAVTVGGPAGLVFSPNEVKANVGDMVVFTFLAQNHTVTQSPFSTPCQRLEGGMDTGFQANPNGTISPPPQVAMQVMTGDALWFYCRQGPHCGKGMVMSINPTAEKTQAMFQSLAIAQNGTGAGGAITGNPAAGAPAPNPAAGAPASSAAPSVVDSASSTLAQLPTETANAGGAAQPTNGVVAGVGTLLPDGACQCSCDCINAGFVNGVGLGAIGGVGGAIPANMPGMSRRR